MPIDVVIPVYRGFAETRSCVESVLAAPCTQAFELVVVDDCSPEPELSAWLAQLAAVGRLTLLRNEHNRGFVASVNRAMALHPERDVVLLNSDTEVANDWLDRIVAAARRHPDAATLTPFSNNATICSYPAGGSAELPGSLELGALDALCARTLAAAVLDLPTAVGFCMFIRRAALDVLGGFDEQAFGRGYGEENDFSRRALKAGWRNLLCADVYVRHRGSVSFGADRFPLMQAGAAALLARHPEYDEVIRAFVADDPVAPLRAELDAARKAGGEKEAGALTQVGEDAATAAVATPTPCRATDGTDALPPRCSRPVLLHVCHSWGGGTQRWIEDFAAADDQGWNLLLRSRSSRSDAGAGFELIDLGGSGHPVLQSWKLEQPIGACEARHEPYRAMVQALVEDFDVGAVIVSSLIGHALDVFDLGLPVAVVMHDLFPFCPALFGHFGSDCVRCGGAELERCLESNPYNVFWHQGPAAHWLQLRAAYATRLMADQVQVVAPSASVRERYATLFPVLRDKPVRLIPHGLSFVPAALGPRAEVASRAGPGRLRVVVPGRLLPHKGLALLQQLLPAIADVADVLLLGAGQFGAPFAGLAHVRTVYDYSPAQLAGHVAAFAPDCALLASLLPESFSYLLSEMRALGVPVLATARGALAERIVDGEDGFLIAADALAIEARLRELAGRREHLLRVAAAVRAKPVVTAAQMVASYRQLPGLSARAAPSAVRLRHRAAIVEANRARAQLHEIRGQLDQALSDLHSEASEARRREADFAHLLAQEREQRDCETQRLRARLDLVTAERDALLASTSWRVTRPLRSLVDSVRPAAAREPEGVMLEDAAPSAALAVEEHRKRVLHRAGDVLASRWARRIALECEWEAVPLSEAEMNAAFGSTAQLVAESPDVGVVIHCGELPLAGDWDDEWTAALDPAADERMQLRAVKRDQLTLPDACRMAVGVAGVDAATGIRDFARMAMQVGERANGWVFIWVGHLAHRESKENEQDLELQLAIALRRLFVIEDEAFEPWLLAADLYLDTSRGDAHDAGVLEALACGLPVLHGMDPAPAGIVDLIVDWPLAPASGDRQLAERTRARYGGPARTQALFARFSG